MAAKQILSQALGDLMFSISQGLSAQASAPGAMGRKAGIAAAFGGPMVLEEQNRKRAMEDQQRQMLVDQMASQDQTRRFETAKSLYEMQKGTPSQNIPVPLPQATPSPIGGIQGEPSFGGMGTAAAPMHPPIDFGGGMKLSPPTQQGETQAFLDQLNRELQLKKSFEKPAPPRGLINTPGGTIDMDNPTGGFIPGTAPAAAAARTPFEAWREQNPKTPIADWIRLNEGKSTSSSETQWVLRDGRPLEVPKGGSKPGDVPYDIVAQRKPEGGGPSAYSVERENRTLQSVGELRNKVNRWTTGVGSLMSIVPGTEARNFAAELATLKANVAFNELTAMREASKTGGALGNVSNVELGLLESALGGLDPGQSPANLVQQLNKIEGSIKRWRTAQTNVAAGTGNLPGGGGPAPGTIKNGYVFKGGDPNDSKNWVKQ